MAVSNAEGLNVAAVLETTQGQSPPPNAGWLNLEADSVGDPGADYKKMARTPFTITRQKRRPFISGMDVTLTLDLDVTKDHLDFFGEAIFKSSFKHSGGKGQSLYHPTAVTATGYTVPALGDYAANRLFVARGFNTPANNGLKLSVLSANPLEIKFAGLTAEAAPPSNAQLEFVGIQAPANGDFELDGNGDWTSATVDLTTLGLTVGQEVYFPSQAEALAMGDVNYAMSNAAYYGRAIISAITPGKVSFVYRQWTVGAADPAAGQKVRVFFTKWVRDVARNHADENISTHAFEFTYSDLAAGPADAYEYVFGCMLDKAVFSLPTEGKMTMQLTFVGTTVEDPSTVRHPGPATALNVVTGLAISSSSDMKRLAVSNVDETGLMTDFRDLKITLANNVAGEKVVGHLGNKYTPLGVFEAMMEGEALFSAPEIVTAVRDNRILRVTAGGRNDDFGMGLDIPSAGSLESKKKIEHNKIISISSKIDGFMDAKGAYTASMSMFGYLPAA